MTALLTFSAFASDQSALSSSGCEHLLIKAEKRFQDSYYRRNRGDGAGGILPFGEIPVPRLKPFLKPIELSSSEFLDNPEWKDLRPPVRDYLRARRDWPATAADGYVLVPVDYYELKIFFARGVLPPRADGVARDVITLGSRQRLRPTGNRVYLVFSRDADVLSKRTGEFPIWSLLAMVSGNVPYLKAFACRNSGSALGMSLTLPQWPMKKPREVPLDRPMVFSAPLNPLQLFSVSEPPSEEDVRFMTFNALDDRMETYSYWIPFVKSEFEITDVRGNHISGRLVELRKVGSHNYDPAYVFSDASAGLIFEDAQGRRHEVVWNKIRDVKMVRYEPNLPDDVRLPLSKSQVALLDALADHSMHPEKSAQRLLILRE